MISFSVHYLVLVCTDLHLVSCYSVTQVLLAPPEIPYSASWFILTSMIVYCQRISEPCYSSHFSYH